MHTATARPACPPLRMTARQQPSTARRLSPLLASMDGRALFGAAAASLVLLCPVRVLCERRAGVVMRILPAPRDPAHALACTHTLLIGSPDI
jgi:hypothetical protein